LGTFNASSLVSEEFTTLKSKVALSKDQKIRLELELANTTLKSKKDR
jgi:hypothetical protein